ncbi:hypothetical protein Ahy_A10g048600 isoform A [Arachis hypogaea]|uniref:RRM domain-containing protein n=1 Tax=Arachis hypogaea TaxID=3818 RepID=A0A445B5H2_ARAHY|nr:hypothetical protein Ahy_A10g048600 isoform A [Arachis hypogaea]
MEFDEYDYLEKTVEDHDDRDSSKKTKKDSSEKTYRKRDELDDDLDAAAYDGRIKKSRAEEENGSRKDRDGRDRERSSRDKDRHRHRSSDRERDGERSSRDRDRDSERSSRDREREREKSKERDRRERDKEREKRERDREKEKEKEKEKERERERKDRERDREREEGSRRSRSRSERDRDRERERDFDSRDGRRQREKKEAAEPEADPERDQRTVFAYQMPLKATERDVYEFFSKAGKVRDVRLIMDRNSRRSKGVGVVSERLDEISENLTDVLDKAAVPMAIALSGQLLLGQPVMVKPSEAEKNLVQSNTTSGAAGVAGPYGAVDRKLYVGNLHFNMTESQLREIFEPFGPVELVQLPLDLETGHCKGFGFVQFAHLEHSKAALSLNGKLEIAGRTIKVSSVTDHVGSQDTTAKSADFDDDEGGLALNAQSRALLMQKLDRSGIAASIGVPPVVNGSAPAQQAVSLPIGNPGIIPAPTLPTQLMTNPVAEPVGTPSECLLLKNMFDPATETEPDFDLDIKEDVEEECSKYGRVKHISVDKNSAGFVYLQFETVEAASAAQRALHLRWFARRLISALFMQPQMYEEKFKGEV